MIEKTHNTARFFTEQRLICRVLRAVGARRSRRRATARADAPPSVDIRATARALDTYAKAIAESGAGSDVRTITGKGFAALDFKTTLDDASVLRRANEIVARHLPEAERHPDFWRSRAGARAPRGRRRRQVQLSRGGGPRFWFSVGPELQQLN